MRRRHLLVVVSLALSVWGCRSVGIDEVHPPPGLHPVIHEKASACASRLNMDRDRAQSALTWTDALILAGAILAVVTGGGSALLHTRCPRLRTILALAAALGGLLGGLSKVVDDPVAILTRRAAAERLWVEAGNFLALVALKLEPLSPGARPEADSPVGGRSIPEMLEAALVRLGSCAASNPADIDLAAYEKQSAAVLSSIKSDAQDPHGVQAHVALGASPKCVDRPPFTDPRPTKQRVVGFESGDRTLRAFEAANDCLASCKDDPACRRRCVPAPTQNR